MAQALEEPAPGDGGRGGGAVKGGTMARKTSTGKRLRQALEAPLMRLGLALVPRLPRGAVLALARMLGNGAYLFSARSRRLGLANLDLAFGAARTPAEKRRILRASLRNFSLTMLDLLWFSRNSEARMARWLAVTPGMRDAMAIRVARVGVTGHFGNWELIGRYWALAAGGLTSVAMPLKNPAVGELLREARELTGQQIVARDGALKKLVRCLRDGGTVGLLLDQNTDPDEGGTFADFFGKPVSVSPAAGSLASLTGAEIIFAYALPRPDGTYLGEMPHLIPAAEIAALDRATAAQELTQRITGFYEEAIRVHPECWLWSYKRWRHVPPGMPKDGFPYYAK